MYKVFFNDNKIFFSENFDVKQLPANTLVIEYNNDFSLDILLKKINNENRKVNYLLLCNNSDSLFEEFKANFKLIDAAGGLIFNKKNELLGIFRRGKWDLPKGKVDKNESFEKAAIRECQEETGLVSLKIINKLPETYHTYFQNKWILKRTHWYKMELLIDEPTIPQTEEDINEIKWFRLSELEEFKSNTFASIKEILPIS